MATEKYFAIRHWTPLNVFDFAFLSSVWATEGPLKCITLRDLTIPRYITKQLFILLQQLDSQFSSR